MNNTEDWLTSPKHSGFSPAEQEHSPKLPGHIPKEWGQSPGELGHPPKHPEHSTKEWGQSPGELGHPPKHPEHSTKEPGSSPKEPEHATEHSGQSPEKSGQLFQRLQITPVAPSCATALFRGSLSAATTYSIKKSIFAT